MIQATKGSHYEKAELEVLIQAVEECVNRVDYARDCYRYACVKLNEIREKRGLGPRTLFGIEQLFARKKFELLSYETALKLEKKIEKKVIPFSEVPFSPTLLDFATIVLEAEGINE